jgi:hypothetical protein
MFIYPSYDLWIYIIEKEEGKIKIVVPLHQTLPIFAIFYVSKQTSIIFSFIINNMYDWVCCSNFYLNVYWGNLIFWLELNCYKADNIAVGIELTISSSLDIDFTEQFWGCLLVEDCPTSTWILKKKNNVLLFRY